MLHFVIGGARSGKSRYAESLAQQQEDLGKKVFYIATTNSRRKDSNGQIDKEMLQRIEIHQSERPSRWETIETPVFLVQTLKQLDAENHCILVDCLTLWTLNLMEDNTLLEQKKALLELLPELSAKVVIVSNEVGMGIVPLGAFTRQYVDELGWLHQAVAECSNATTFMVSGIPMSIKSS